MQTERGHWYEAIFEHGGVEIRNVRESTSIAYMQGDEAAQLQDELERAGEYSYPRGVFADCESLIDELLGQYA